MWSTATLLHAAGRKLYRKGDDWKALPEAKDGYQEAGVFDFVPVRVSVDRELRTRIEPGNGDTPMRILHLTDVANYERAMFTSMRNLLSALGEQHR